MKRLMLSVGFLLGLGLGAQINPLDPNLFSSLKALQQAGAANQLPGQLPAANSLPGQPALPPPPQGAESPQVQKEEERVDQEVSQRKAREHAPLRFAEDLFEVRQKSTAATEGGIAEDYILGTGDQLGLNAFGSATFEVPVQVDGRGEIVVPKLGTVKVGGYTLARAKAAVQGLVNRNFSNTTVDLTVLKLREVRIFVLGEVYKPGSYMVPSLSSIVNVLSLAGGPTAVGSFREIRVVRGGSIIHKVDLYPLRAEGMGNMNISLQNGDTIFVPLAFNQVMLEGAFTRVVAATGKLLETGSKKTEKTEKVVPERQRGDQRLEGDWMKEREMVAEPEWLTRWQQNGLVPSLQFELLPGETAADALRYAGGLVIQAFTGNLALRRLNPRGVVDVMDLAASALARTPLMRGDVMSALPRRDRMERAVEIRGWVRVAGVFARLDGLTVGTLLKRENQVLPDTYLGRGEIVRTLPDGSTRYLAFDVAKALNGDAIHDLLLENRDRIELYRIQDLRLPQTVTVVGPLTKPGTFEFHEGMRAADLLFRGGVLQKNADRFTAELAHTRDGKPSEVRKLDLAKLLSTEQSSPVNLKDDELNPIIKPFDQLSIYAKPDYRVHRVVTLIGQVARPGTYVLDQDRANLRDLIARAGGLTDDAMPQAGIFLRHVGKANPETVKANELQGVMPLDPTSEGVNAILNRLSETKRQPITGALLTTPVLHALQSGSLNRLVVNLPAVLAGSSKADVELQDGDQIIIPRKTDAAYVVGETASPFAVYKVEPGMTVKNLLAMAGGTTRNADTWNIRLLKADGRILDSGVTRQTVDPGDAVLVPQRVRRDVGWQENLAALTPLAILLNAIK